MDDLFLSLLNTSISASYLVLAVAAVRLMFKKAPKWLMPALWGLVALRLMFPVSVESVLSLVPSAQPIPANIAYARAPAIDSGIPLVNHTVNQALTTMAPVPEYSANPLQILLEAAGWVWLIGVAVMLLYTLISYLRLRHRVRDAGLVEKGIYRSRAVDSPFVLGLFRPRIYLPMSTSEEDAFYIIAHEKAHLRRRDHYWKPLGFVLLAIHWFNPLMWLAYVLLCRDIELACDERVIKELGREGRADYSQALLSATVRRRSIAACPLAFGEVGVKQRVKSVLNYKKPGFWIVCIAVIASIVVAVCFLTDPVTEEKVMTLDDVRHLAQKGKTLDWDDFDGFAYEWTGGGMHMRTYGLEEEPFQLIVNGKSTLEKPDFIALDCKEEGSRVDIRQGNVEHFIKIHSHEANPIADNHWNIILNATDITPTGATLVFGEAYDEDRIDATYAYDEQYILFGKKADGSWYSLPKRKNADLPVVRHSLFDDATQTINWEEVYGSLPDGEYRLVKFVEDYYGEGEPGRFQVWAEFGLRGTDKPLITAQDIVALLDDPENLDWDDFENYFYTEEQTPYENLQYMRHYDLGSGLRLHLSGPSEEEPLRRLLVQCDGEGVDGVQVLHPREKGPDWWNRELSRPQWEALGMKEFLALHSMPLPDAYTNHYGVTFALERATATGAQVRFRAVPPEGYQVRASDQYQLYVYKRGIWETVPTLPGKEWPTQIFGAEHFSDRTINWEERYGVLPSGRYRLEIELEVQYPEGSHEALESYPSVGAEFTLNLEAPGDSNTFGISLVVEEASSREATVVFTIGNPELYEFLGGDRYELLGGNDYSICREENGLWTPVPKLAEPVFGEELYSITNVRRHTIGWGWLYGSLPQGHYRIAKKVTCRDFNADTAEPDSMFMVYGEFWLDKPLADAARPFDPAEIHDLTTAYLQFGSEQYQVTDKEDLGYLEGILSNVKEEKGLPGCPFSSTIYLLRSDGEVFAVQHAEDSCDCLVWGDRCFSYDPGFDRDVWQVFGLEEYEVKKSYDITGKVIREESFEWNRPVPGSVVEYTYDTQGQLILKEWLDENYEVEESHEFGYDEWGNQIFERHNLDDGRITWVQRVFDEENRLMKETGYGDDGEVGTETVYTYDQQGWVQQILETVEGEFWSDRRYEWRDDTHYRVYNYGHDGQVLYSHHCTNNEQGQLIKQEFYNAWGNQENTREYEYPEGSDVRYVYYYDAKGELIETYRENLD